MWTLGNGEAKVIKKLAHNVAASDTTWEGKSNVCITPMYYKVQRACKKIRSPDGPQEEKKKTSGKAFLL